MALNSLVSPILQFPLEDLIIAACNDAKQKVNDKSNDEMKRLTGGLSLPAGLKLPF